MKLNNVLATFRRDVPIRIGTTLMLIVSLAVLTAPARAWDLSAEAKLHDLNGNQVGRVKLTQQGEGGSVVVEVRVHDLPPNFHGFHGFHVHAVGECTPPFTTAGAHFDLDKHDHGNHSGDLPVLLVEADGTANARFITDRFTIADLFDADGSAIIIHANPDNYINIPLAEVRYVDGPDAAAPGALTLDAMTLATGDAGSRIACGVVKKVVERDRRDSDREREREHEHERER